MPRRAADQACGKAVRSPMVKRRAKARRCQASRPSSSAAIVRARGESGGAEMASARKTSASRKPPSEVHFECSLKPAAKCGRERAAVKETWVGGASE
eukprot:scaffold23366_cov112-Isochrysis_galbana.AAC.3